MDSRNDLKTDYNKLDKFKDLPTQKYGCVIKHKCRFKGLWQK